MRVAYEIVIRQYPAVERHCAKCGEKKPFLPSDQIRVNAQKKLLDVWLIHRCRDCGRTWNMEVFERVSPGQLEKKLYNRLLENDAALIRDMAFDRALHARMGAPLCLDTLEYEILGERFSPDALSEPCELQISCPVPIGVRLSRILREILGLSAGEFEALAGKGRIASPDAENILKARMETRHTVRVLPRE